MPTSIRAKIDSELTRRIGEWFTVREIQDKLRVNPSTLKPLIMKYAREKVLRRRHVKGTARSVQFSPASSNNRGFQGLLQGLMPYRNVGLSTAAKKTSKKAVKRPAKRSTRKTSRRR